MLTEDRVVTAKARVGSARKQVADGPGLILELVSDGAGCPATLGVIALVLETSAVDVVDRMERRVDVESEVWI